MSDEGKRRAEMYRAAKAKEVFAYEIFAEAIEHLRD